MSACTSGGYHNLPSNTLAIPPPPTRDVVRYPGSLHGGRGVRPNDASSRCTERSIPTQKFHIDDTSNPPPPRRQTPAWTRIVLLDAPGQRHGQQPLTQPKHVRTHRGSECAGRERPIGDAEGKQTNTMACPPPPPRRACQCPPPPPRARMSPPPPPGAHVSAPPRMSVPPPPGAHV